MLAALIALRCTLARWLPYWTLILGTGCGLWVIAQCPWARTFSPSTSLQVFQYVLANSILEVILRQISFLSRGKKVVLHSLLLDVKGTTSLFAHLKKFCKFVFQNPCQSFSILNHPCLCFSILANYYFQVSSNLKVIWHIAKVTQTPRLSFF